MTSAKKAATHAGKNFPGGRRNAPHVRPLGDAPRVYLYVAEPKHEETRLRLPNDLKLK